MQTKRISFDLNHKEILFIHPKPQKEIIEIMALIDTILTDCLCIIEFAFISLRILSAL